jgi:hypothetical protein
MTLCHALLLAFALDLPTAEVDNLKGRGDYRRDFDEYDRHTGELVELNDTSVVLKKGDSSRKVPLADVLEIRFPAAPPPDASTGARIALLDGTKLTLREFSISGDYARCETAFGIFSVPVTRLLHVRFGISTARLDETWNGLLARESKNDLLVVRKEDALDFLAGVTGDVGEKIGFLLDGDEVPVPREKAFGIIFHRRAPNIPKTLYQVRLTGGDILETTRLSWDGKQLTVRLAAGTELALPAALVSAIDFRPGKIKHLSELEPRDVKYVPFFDIISEYRRDRSLDGTPLALSGKTFSRGLAIHSKTTLRYRIAGEFTRFLAVAGIDDTVSRLGIVDEDAKPKIDERARSAYVRLVISGDGKPLFNSIVKGGDPPRVVDLDMTGIRDLEILVDYGNDNPIADHLDLADAKLVK